MRYNVFLLFSFNVNMLTVYRQVGLLLTEQRKTRVISQNGCSHFFVPLQVLLWQHHLDCGPPVPVGKTPAHHTCAGPGQPTPRTHTYIHTAGPSKTCHHSKCTNMYCIAHIACSEYGTSTLSRSADDADESYVHTPWPPVGKHDMGFSLLPSPHPSFFSLSYPPSFLSALMRALTSLLAD